MVLREERPCIDSASPGQICQKVSWHRLQLTSAHVQGWRRHVLNRGTRHGRAASGQCPREYSSYKLAIGHLLLCQVRIPYNL